MVKEKKIYQDRQMPQQNLVNGITDTLELIAQTNASIDVSLNIGGYDEIDMQLAGYDRLKKKFEKTLLNLLRNLDIPVQATELEMG